jgi:ribonuclease HI
MKKFIIFTDGGSKGNPGPAAIGVIICNQKGEVWKKYSQFIGENKTNNEAEYEAAIFALSKLKQILGKRLAKSTEVQIRSDSELLVKQISGEYKVLEPKIKELFLELWNLKVDFKSVQFKLIPREKNKEADQLVNEALKALP